MLSIERCYQSRQVLFNFLLINDTVVREFNFKWKPYRKKQVEANETIFTESLKMHEKKTKSNFEIKNLAADTKKLHLDFSLVAFKRPNSVSKISSILCRRPNIFLQTKVLLR